VYSYDPIGYCQQTTFKASGSSGALLQPLLDNQVGYQNMENVTPEPIPMEKAMAILKDTFISAAERDIYTGDSIFINIITKDGIKEEKFTLRRD
jgi:20S proteasome subunit beta 6